MLLRHATARLVATILVALPVATAGAADEPTLAARVPAGSVAESRDATLLNPAGLVRLSGWSLAYRYTGVRLAEGPQTRGGHGLWLALPMGGTAAFGISQELRMDAALPKSFSSDDADVLRTAFALGLGGPTFALGATLSTVGAADDAFERFWTWDAGIQAAPWRWISLGATARDLGRPAVSDATGAHELDRRFELGLAVRPGTDRVTVGGTLAARQPDWAVDSAGGYLEVVPMDGTWLRVGADRCADGTVAGALTFGLDLERVGLSAAMLSSRDGDTLRADGFSAGVRVSGDRYAPIVDPKPRLAELSLAGSLPETRSAPLPFLPALGPTFRGLMRMLDRARRDPMIGGVLLKVNRLRVNVPQAEELRAALDRLQAAGKRVLAHLVEPDHRVYLAVAGADELRLHPASGLYLTGVQISFSYYAKTLERVGVAADFISIGKYKSAPDAFERDGMGEAQREAETALLDSVFGDLVAGVARGRKRTEDEVRAWIDQGPYEGRRAKTAGLIDGVGHYDEWREELSKSGERFVRGLGGRRRRDERWGRRPRIAVVHVDGTIAGGESQAIPLFGQRTAGANTVARALDAVRKDDRVKAVVLRINSPGGSGTASETIWRAARRLAEKKPLVASLANVAASGGYYAAVGADWIVADPSTVTGSIGVFAGKFDLSGLYEHLSVKRETLKRGARADLLSLDRRFTDEERKTLTDNLTALYEQFLSRIDETRGLELDAIRAVAEGRVWSGRDAKRHGLVDELGGFDAALREAMKRAGLTELDEPIVATATGRRGFSGLDGLVQAVREETATEAQTLPTLLVGDLVESLGPLLGGALRAGEPLFLMDPLVQVK